MNVTERRSALGRMCRVCAVLHPRKHLYSYAFMPRKHRVSKRGQLPLGDLDRAGTSTRAGTRFPGKVSRAIYGCCHLARGLSIVESRLHAVLTDRSPLFPSGSPLP